MTDTSDESVRTALEEILSRLDDLTDRVTRLETAGQRRTPSVSSLGVAEGEYEDEGPGAD